MFAGSRRAGAHGRTLAAKLKRACGLIAGAIIVTHQVTICSNPAGPWAPPGGLCTGARMHLCAKCQKVSNSYAASA
jgi:hypothetical protein